MLTLTVVRRVQDMMLLLNESQVLMDMDTTMDTGIVTVDTGKVTMVDTGIHITMIVDTGIVMEVDMDTRMTMDTDTRMIVDTVTVTVVEVGVQTTETYRECSFT